MKTTKLTAAFTILILNISVIFSGQNADSSGQYNSPGGTGFNNYNAAVIDLSDRNLIEVPDHVFRNIYTEELILKDNNILSLPKDIRRLTFLKVLDLSGTCITEVPEEIHHLVLLQELILPYENFIFKTEHVRKLTHAKIILR